VYFLLKGGIEYVPQEQGVLDEVWNKLFMGVFGTEEVSKYMLQSFARAMAGEIKDKRLFFIIGEPNSGKGTITEVFRLAFASQFNTLNAQDFCAKKSDGNSALSNQHLVQGRDKRVAFLNETSRAKGQEWNAQAIKVFSNGGESISGRLNYDREAKCFINQQTGFCNMNDLYWGQTHLLKLWITVFLKPTGLHTAFQPPPHEGALPLSPKPREITLRSIVPDMKALSLSENSFTI
jgi:hypothetical protein